MERREFEKLVVDGFDALPEWVREKIDNVALLVEDEPSEEERREQGLEDNETLLGLYKGIPLSERGDGYGLGATLPDTITIYQRPTEEAAGGDPEKIREVVSETIFHEFAHHFGLDEDEVEEREARRRQRE